MRYSNEMSGASVKMSETGKRRYSFSHATIHVFGASRFTSSDLEKNKQTNIQTSSDLEKKTDCLVFQSHLMHINAVLSNMYLMF